MQALFTISVITYNSSDTILETLNSTKDQTWPFLELLISDDCSTDNTLELCQNWLNENKQKFVNTRIITFDRNSGVPANLNRALYYAKGEWIHFLAGDDTLKPNCIEDNMTWVSLHPEAKVLFSFIEVYRNKFEHQNLIGIIPDDPFNQNGIMAPARSADSQYKMLLISDRIHFTPSAILHRETLLSIGGGDERFKLLEDYPLWLNLTKNGYRLNFMDKVTVNYRSHYKAINNTGKKFLVNPNYFKQEDFRKIYTYPFLPVDIWLNQRFCWYASQIFRFKWLNKNQRPNTLILALLTIYLNPFKYYIYLKKRFSIHAKNNEFYI